MKRQYMSRAQSGSLFKRGAKRHGKNGIQPMRGGIRA